MYYETKDVKYEYQNEELAPPIILSVFDTDDGWLDSTDDYIGKAVIYMKDLKHLPCDDTIPEPKWYNIKYNQSDPDDENGAKVLVSFAKKDFDDDKWWEYKED